MRFTEVKQVIKFDRYTANLRDVLPEKYKGKRIFHRRIINYQYRPIETLIFKSDNLGKFDIIRIEIDLISFSYKLILWVRNISAERVIKKL